MEKAQPLQNISIVVTRPHPQSINLCAELEALGAKAISFPCMEIGAFSSFNSDEIYQLLPQFDLIIFISTNAVQFGLEAFPDFAKQLRSKCKIAAVGAATAQTLQNHGFDHIVRPADKFDSESLLALPELQQLRQKSVLIIKGLSGRDMLHKTLRSYGANVHSIDVYQRTLPKIVDLSVLNGKIDLLLLTSGESAKNFRILTSESTQNSFLECQTVVGHARIAEKVSSLGFRKLPIIAATPSDADMLTAILEWASCGIDTTHSRKN